MIVVQLTREGFQFDELILRAEPDLPQIPLVELLPEPDRQLLSALDVGRARRPGDRGVEPSRPVVAVFWLKQPPFK